MKTMPSGFFNAIPSMSSSGRLDISAGQEELLLWDSKLSHYDIRNTQALMHNGDKPLHPILVPKYQVAIKCNIPLCSACLRGKGKRTPLSSTIQKVNVKYSDALKKYDLKSGDCVSTDQYERNINGRLPYTKGK